MSLKNISHFQAVFQIYLVLKYIDMLIIVPPSREATLPLGMKG